MYRQLFTIKDLIVMDLNESSTLALVALKFSTGT
jgi:hypothetical protein